MAHIDTLQYFENLVSSGVPEEQAKAQVHALNASFDNVATKDDLFNLEYRLENKIDSKFNMLLILGGAMFLVSALPVLEKFVGFMRG